MSQTKHRNFHLYRFMGQVIVEKFIREVNLEVAVAIKTGKK